VNLFLVLPKIVQENIAKFLNEPFTSTSGLEYWTQETKTITAGRLMELLSTAGFSLHYHWMNIVVNKAPCGHISQYLWKTGTSKTVDQKNSGKYFSKKSDCLSPKCLYRFVPFTEKKLIVIQVKINEPNPACTSLNIFSRWSFVSCRIRLMFANFCKSKQKKTMANRHNWLNLPLCILLIPAAAG